MASSPSPSASASTSLSLSLDSLRQKLSSLKSNHSNLTHNLQSLRSHLSTITSSFSTSTTPTSTSFLSSLSQDPTISSISSTLTNQDQILNLYRTTGITIFEFDLNVGNREREIFKEKQMRREGVDVEDLEEVETWLDGFLADEKGKGKGKARTKEGLGIGVRLESFYDGQFHKPHYLLFASFSPSSTSDSRTFIQNSTLSSPSLSTSTCDQTQLILLRHTLPHFLDVEKLIGESLVRGGQEREGGRGSQGDEDGDAEERRLGGLELLGRLKSSKMEEFIGKIHRLLNCGLSRSQQLFGLKDLSGRLPGLELISFESKQVKNEILNLIGREETKSDQDQEGVEKDQETKSVEQRRKKSTIDLETFANENFTWVLIRWNLPSRILFGYDGGLEDKIEGLLESSLREEEEEEDQSQETEEGKKRKRKSNSEKLKKLKTTIQKEEEIRLEFEIKFEEESDRLGSLIEDDLESGNQDHDDDDFPRPDSQSQSSRKKSKKSKSSGNLTTSNKGSISIHLIKKDPISALDYNEEPEKKKKRKEIQRSYDRLLQGRREETEIPEEKIRRKDLERLFLEDGGEDDDNGNGEEEDEQKRRKGEAGDLDVNVGNSCWKVWRELKG